VANHESYSRKSTASSLCGTTCQSVEDELNDEL
jgi:hypothetical protein